MHLFRQSNRTEDERSRRIYAAYELAYTIVDFCAALSFLGGSLLFLLNGNETVARALMVLGSMLFVTKPAIRFTREVKLAARGDVDNLAKRLSD